MSNTDAGSGAVQSVDRALTILSLLAERGEMGVTEISQGLGVHKSTAFRLVATLERHDIVSQTEDRGKYRLGVGVLRLAGATRVRLDLVNESRPVTTALAARVGETVNIVVLSGHEALYLDQVAGPSALQMHMWAGQRVPLHATSNGKVLLAFGAGDGDRAAAGPAAAISPTTRSGPSPSWTPSWTWCGSGDMPWRSTSSSKGLTAVAAPIFGDRRARRRVGQRVRPELPAPGRPAARRRRAGPWGRHRHLAAAGLAWSRHGAHRLRAVTDRVGGR